MIDLTPFGTANVVYLVELTIDGVLYLKPGYSAKVAQRMKNIVTSYKVVPRLLCVRYVHSECTEKEFHKLLRTKYPELHRPMVVGGKERVEIYVHDSRIVDEFSKYDFACCGPDAGVCVTRAEFEALKKELVDLRMTLDAHVALRRHKLNLNS
jgi:hypothetical protein